MTSAPLPPPDPDLAAALRLDLLEAGFTVTGVAAYLGERAFDALGRGFEAAARDRCAADENPPPVGVLIRFFTFGQTVPDATLEAALPRTGTAGVRRLGLLESAAGGCRAAWDVRPYGDETHDWWVVSDHGARRAGRGRGPLPTDHVLGIGAASLTLAAWTPRPTVRRALDLGTGSGIQALHLGTHCSEVVVTDISQRALGCARLTAALAGRDWDVRAGSLLEPVAGERFDLVVSNPPFVISPRDAPGGSGEALYEYRDAGLVGDALTWQLVAELPGVLAPGGLAVLLANWETRPGEDWRDRWRTAAVGLDADLWVVRREVVDPSRYAETWAADAGAAAGSEEFDGPYRRWLADFDARGVAEIHFGIVVLHRADAEARVAAGSGEQVAAGAGGQVAAGAGGRAPWRDFTDALGPLGSPLGQAVLEGVATRSLLADEEAAGTLPERLLGTAWVCAPDVTELRSGRPGQDPSVILVRQGGGLRRDRVLDSLGAALLSVCDGEITAGQALTAIAALTGVDLDSARSEAIPLLRALVADGLLHDANVAP